MGEVISISRVSDLDIFSEFDAQCPSIPQDIDGLIRQSAESAVDQQQFKGTTGAFKTACVAVVVLSLVALAGVKFVASNVAGNYSASRYGEFTTSTRSTDWRESREAWQTYINYLQNDPRIIHLQTEQKLFKQQYPD